MDDPPDELLEQARARVGRTLCGKYRVDRLIGIGGMAAVFEGTHLRNANRVALKILHRDPATQKDTRARFLREGYAANSVGHPGAVRVLDDDKGDDGSISWSWSSSKARRSMRDSRRAPTTSGCPRS